MPTSGPTCSSEASFLQGRPGHCRDLLHDDEGVTEVVGQILVFGILSTVLVLSMVAFGAAKDTATERAANLQAEGIAQQVASTVVEAALFVEKQPTGTTYERELLLPQQLEGRSYEIRLENASGSLPDRVIVAIPGIGAEKSASVLAASAPANVDLCESNAHGGRLAIRYDAIDPADPSSFTCLFLEEVT